jgi:sugar-specific transcriptional regulator TrmB
MNKEELNAKLQIIGLNSDEATVFIALLEGHKTHQQLSDATKINRTTVYRVVDDLTKKGIAHEVTTDEGRHIASADLRAVELLVAEDELKLQEKEDALKRLIELVPSLVPDIEGAFEVKTFYGVSGLKQMLWNELKSKREIVMFSKVSSLNGVAGKRFADKFRLEIMDRGIKQRALCNSKESTGVYSDYSDEYTKFYDERYIDPSVLPINQEMTVHDETVSIYNWDRDVRVGTEIHNVLYADFMRSTFERFWADIA